MNRIITILVCVILMFILLLFHDNENNTVKKIESYQTNHIYMGDRLIITFETEQCPLNFRIVENLIEKYLM